jgi:hypothetical protein
MYFHDNEALGIAFRLRPSARAELEITDVNHAYLERGQLCVEMLGLGVAGWELETLLAPLGDIFASAHCTTIAIMFLTGRSESPTPRMTRPIH